MTADSGSTSYQCSPSELEFGHCNSVISPVSSARSVREVCWKPSEMLATAATKPAMSTKSARKAWWRSPKLLATALAMTLVMGLGSWRFSNDEQASQDQFRAAVQGLAVTYAEELARQVRTSISSTHAIAAMLQVDDANFTQNGFETIAAMLIETYGGISNLQLAPFGKVTAIVPLVDATQDNRAVLGHNLLVDPDRRLGALQTIQSRQTLVLGPLQLKQGGAGIIVRHPVFTRFAPEFVPSEPFLAGGEVYTVDCSTPALQRENCYFPGPDVEVAGVQEPTYFFAFATMISFVPTLLGPVQLERLADGGHNVEGTTRFAYQLQMRVPHPSLEDVQGVFAHSPDHPPGAVLPDPVEAAVSLPEVGLEWSLRVAPAEGWPAVSAEFWTQLALLVLLTCITGLVLGGLIIGNVRETLKRAAELEVYRDRKLRSQVAAATSDTMRSRFPMCVMQVSEFKRVGRLLSHEEARDQGSLVFLDTTAKMESLKQEGDIAFFSHQWTSFVDPDPSGKHYAAMVSALDALAATGWPCTHVWVDYHSIPQANRDQQQNAINSLSLYVACSRIFVAVTPTCTHQELGETLDTASYRRRGWCRVEQLSFLATNTQSLSAFVYDGCGLQPLWASTEDHAMSLGIFEGDFTCCRRKHCNGLRCDKQRLVNVMLAMYWELLHAQATSPDASALVALLADEPRFFPVNAQQLRLAADGSLWEAEVELFGDLLPVLHELFEHPELLPNRGLEETAGAETEPVEPEVCGDLEML
ncbi:unnamed protein product [Prorocentrum cordatum]|uniref:CHASE domain-containing protein n=1 Tax=Prorocentrum cordatum TaxID=2364126 RepID=A0ABN9UJP3_9DINO|nr:unnamed protein product [Polarella glacialis]CAK0867377.1 unnamed protein product [Polarella glacialis]